MLCIPSYSHLYVPVVEVVQVQPVGSSEGCVLTIAFVCFQHTKAIVCIRHMTCGLNSVSLCQHFHTHQCMCKQLTLLWVIVYASGSALSTETNSMYESELHYSVTEFCSCVFKSE